MIDYGFDPNIAPPLKEDTIELTDKKSLTFSSVA